MPYSVTQAKIDNLNIITDSEISEIYSFLNFFSFEASDLNSSKPINSQQLNNSQEIRSCVPSSFCPYFSVPYFLVPIFNDEE